MAVPDQLLKDLACLPLERPVLDLISRLCNSDADGLPGEENAVPLSTLVHRKVVPQILRTLLRDTAKERAHQVGANA